MEKKDTLSSCSESEEQQMQLIQDKSKESCMIDEEQLHKESVDSRLNKDICRRQWKSYTSKALDLFCNIEPPYIYDEEPMAEVPVTADNNVFATRQHHTEQHEFNNEGEVDHDAEQSHDIRPLPAKLTCNQTTELSNQSLESENTYLKKIVA
ncbi:hypothetical protein Tco_0576830 [Tanacetum coccineum]